MANPFTPGGNMQCGGAVGTIVYCGLKIAEAYGVKGLTDEICISLATAVAFLVAYIHDVIAKYLDNKISKEVDQGQIKNSTS